MNQKQKRYLYLVVFTSGLTTLGIELSASRLLGPVFGASNIVWANIIGLILLYLTAGYFLGGRIADRSPQAGVFYQLICWGAFTAGLIPILSKPVLQMAANAVLNLNGAVLVGSFVVTLILFAIPITLLGTVSPFAIRLALEDAEQAGSVSGRMYAISTIGSLIGTFLPTLVLIPWIGTQLTFMLLGGTLLLIALVGLAINDRKRALFYAALPLILLVLTVVIPRGNLRPPPQGSTLIYEDESAYNYIQVANWNNANILLLNEGQGIHSIYYPEYPDFIETAGTWDYFLVAPYFNNPPYTIDDVGSLAMVGLAAGTTPKQYTQIYGPIPIDGMEIDPDIINVGREYFNMTESNINVIEQDGRLGLAQSEKTYDVINIDAYKLPYIPWHMTTVEFFQEVHDHLNADGVAAINVGRTVTDRRLIDTLAATMGQVFETVHVIDVAGSCNSIMVATVQPTSPQNLLDNLALMDADVHPLLQTMLERAYNQVQPTPQDGIVLTDDKAAVELMTDLLLVNFMLSGSSTLPCQ